MARSSQSVEPPEKPGRFTTIVTLLMVFLIQNTQNRDSAALQTKLDELIRTPTRGMTSIGIEKLTEKELFVLHERCECAAKKNQAPLDTAPAERRRRGDHGDQASRSA
ncbi:low affinity Fe/Cu permease [Variovorax boronicumulans]|uniref:Low affinity Fe/Cu permease n=1 Tax=Variovorax boronicumulans TaxID=436515 RepID=A0AAW8DT42_9BURK|nr:low affinity Fe/Cu permease [Variovorax boronicumulans]MDP9922612.1 low affinity Fe/Cu permease [Variovorax boronicumulans]